MRKTLRNLGDSNNLQPLTLLSLPQGIPTSFNSSFFHKLSKMMRMFLSWSHSNLSRKRFALPRVVSTFISFRPSASAISPWIISRSGLRDTFATTTTSNNFSCLTRLSMSSKSLDLPTPPTFITSSMIEALDSRGSSFLSTDPVAEVVAVTIPVGVFS
ncbi:hypothetical protein BT93_E0741 [Corymbia citriodora subsp. variegata]|nr:hypothetical protein BT93_E0741 [Corymbia citriodora subsp. variegata]